MSEQDERTGAPDEVLQRSIPSVAEAVAAGVTANLVTPAVKAAVEGVVQKVKDHNAPEVIHLPPTDSESWGSE